MSSIAENQNSTLDWLINLVNNGIKLNNKSHDYKTSQEDKVLRNDADCRDNAFRCGDILLTYVKQSGVYTGENGKLLDLFISGGNINRERLKVVLERINEHAFDKMGYMYEYVVSNVRMNEPLYIQILTTMQEVMPEFQESST